MNNRLDHITPSSTFEHVPDRGLRYSIPSGENSLSERRIPNFSDLCWIQLRICLQFRATILFAAIIHIVLMRTLKQMAFIETRRIIAFVQAIQFKFEIWVSQLHDDSIDKPWFTFEPYRSISLRMAGERPDDAIIRFSGNCFFEVLESLRDFAKILIGHFGSLKADLSFGLTAASSWAVPILCEFNV